MTTDSTTPADETTLFLGKAWSDPIEAAIRDRIRVFIEELMADELAAALGRYQRRHRAVPRRAGTVTAGDGSAARSERWRSPCRGRGSSVPAARPSSGRVRRDLRVEE